MYKVLFKKTSTINIIYRSIEIQSLAIQRLQQYPHSHNTNETYRHKPLENHSSGTHIHTNKMVVGELRHLFQN